HAGAGAEGRHAVLDPRPQRLEQVEEPGELDHRGRLAARDHQTVTPVELGGTSYSERLDAEAVESGDVLAHVALQSEDPDRAHDRKSYGHRPGEPTARARS